MMPSPQRDGTRVKEPSWQAAGIETKVSGKDSNILREKEKKKN